MVQIRYPIFLAGMAGVPGVQLAAAVSNAGGLGSIGAAYMDENAYGPPKGGGDRRGHHAAG